MNLIRKSLSLVWSTGFSLPTTSRLKPVLQTFICPNLLCFDLGIKKKLAPVLFLVLVSTAIFAAGPGWRKMSENELRSAVPERAPVINERIETEFRTASGITDGNGRRIFGVVIITAGYEADGKYTHFFKTQANLKIGDFKLYAGEYVFGYKRIDADSLNVTFYRASDGETVGSVKAGVERKRGAIYSFLIEPPINDNGAIRIGRFVISYNMI